MRTKNILSVLMAVLMLSMSVASAAVEIRGTVARDDGTHVWTADEFAGFQYDIDTDVSGESMTAEVSGRTIAENGLVYSTEGTTITEANHPTYVSVGWMGDKYVGVGGKTNKIALLVLNMKDDEKKTAIAGQNIDLGAGYVLNVQEVDARTSPRQAWIKLQKNGVTLDDGIVNEKQVYHYNTTVLGDSDTPVFSIYVDSIFSGTESSMIQFKYGWLMDKDSAKEIKVGDTFDSMEVTGAAIDEVILTNKNSITLSADSEVTVMGNMKFKVANDATNLRFYPKIDVVGDVATISSTPTATATPVVTVTPKATAVVNVTAAPCIPEIKTVYVNVTPEPTPIPTVVITPKPAPGFSGIFAIAGLVLVAFIVLRKKQ